MKRYFLLLYVVLVSSLMSAQVTFQFSDGIYNESLKVNVERNVSSLLSEINKAEANHRQLNLTNIDIDEMAASGLKSLWTNIHFRCESNKNVQSCLKDFTGYEIRQIPVEMKPIDNTYKGEIHKELTISFNKKGLITGVRTAIDNNSYIAILQGSNSNVDLIMRREILNFVENFRSYYVEKNINALQEIFSDDALIITGRIIRTLGKNNIEGVS